jgi:hypothetical protein
MSVVPSSLALASIVDDSEIVASDHRNNYAAIQTAVNALISALSGGSSGQVLTASDASDVQWSAGRTIYRKTTAKAVNTTTAATDMLNGEITVAAGAMGSTGVLRVAAWGDWLQNTGAAAAAPRFQLLFGGTTLIDTGALTASSAGFGATRFGWMIDAVIANANATNAQTAKWTHDLSCQAVTLSGSFAAFTVGKGVLNGFGTTCATQRGIAENDGFAIDTSVAKALALNVINGSASASYETKLLGATVEVL